MTNTLSNARTETIETEVYTDETGAEVSQAATKTEEVRVDGWLV